MLLKDSLSSFQKPSLSPHSLSLSPFLPFLPFTLTFSPNPSLSSLSHILPHSPTWSLYQIQTRVKVHFLNILLQIVVHVITCPHKHSAVFTRCEEKK